MKYFIPLLFLLVLSFKPKAQNNANKISLGELDLSKIQQGWNKVHINKNLMNEALSINGIVFEKGICTHAYSEIDIMLNGNGKRFKALVGIDDHVAKMNIASIYFAVVADDDTLFLSKKMGSNQAPEPIDISLEGVKLLRLITHDANNGTNHDHGNWVNTSIEYFGEQKPFILYEKEEDFYKLSPQTSEKPRINGAKVSAARPNSPFLYRIPITGVSPLKVSVTNLPKGLHFDPAKRLITGSIKDKGEYFIKIVVSNIKGKVSRLHKIVISDAMALTPPMGWNSWNAWGMNVSEEKIRQTINAMDSLGLVNHGWTFVNIDDGWQADKRADDGTLSWNEKFKDIKKLADYAHSKGLKLGIYSSPGDYTCGSRLGSRNYETIDANTWANWGIDLLKYDWCSYKNNIPPNASRIDFMKPYGIMNKALKATKTQRDIVYSVCSYGLDKVWEWGPNVGGNLWRTTNDMTDTWFSMKVIGFESPKSIASFSRPNGWNDPDMLILGKLGWGKELRNTRLTCNEQYTHFTQWAMLAAPLFLGCDLTQMDDFTMGLLTNDEVIEVNQDLLGKQATLIYENADIQVWRKELENNKQVIAVYNLGRKATSISLDFKVLGLKDEVSFRDLWKQEDIGTFKQKYTLTLPRHGCKLLKIK